MAGTGVHAFFTFSGWPSQTTPILGCQCPWYKFALTPLAVDPILPREHRKVESSCLVTDNFIGVRHCVYWCSQLLILHSPAAPFSSHPSRNLRCVSFMVSVSTGTIHSPNANKSNLLANAQVGNSIAPSSTLRLLDPLDSTVDNAVLPLWHTLEFLSRFWPCGVWKCTFLSSFPNTEERLVG